MASIRPRNLLDLGYNKLYDLALLRHSQNPANQGFLNVPINILFEWARTEEGHPFWHHISRGEFEEVFKLRPDLRGGSLVVESKGYSLTDNGLFKT